jgi:hypothetical protein
MGTDNGIEHEFLACELHTQAIRFRRIIALRHAGIIRPERHAHQPLCGIQISHLPQPPYRPEPLIYLEFSFWNAVAIFFKYVTISDAFDSTLSSVLFSLSSARTTSLSAPTTSLLSV